jgi:hypothetical protein
MRAVAVVDGITQLRMVEQAAWILVLLGETLVVGLGHLFCMARGLGPWELCSHLLGDCLAVTPRATATAAVAAAEAQACSAVALGVTLRPEAAAAVAVHTLMANLQ